MGRMNALTTGWPRLAARVAALLAITLAGAALAQEAELRQMRDLLARGYYNSAARLDGPNVVAAYPDDAEARFLYARALYLSGDADGARDELQRARQLREHEPVEYLHLDGLLRAAEGDRAGALAALREAFQDSGAYEHAMDWARIAWQLGELDTALEAYALAAQTQRGRREPWPHLDRGRILAFRGDAQEAIEALERAIEVFEEEDAGASRLPSPAYVEAFYRLGRVYERLGDLERADLNYRAARSIDANYTPAAAALEALATRTD